MAEWRYIAQRLDGSGSGGAFLDFELPLSGVQIEDVLSGPDRLTAVIEPEYLRMRDDDGNLLLQEWGTAIYAEVDDEIRYGFILIHSGFQNAEWTLDCIGFSGYATGMPYTASEFFVEADPLDIARHIWEHLQAQPGGDLGMVVDATTSPVRIGTELEQVEFDTQAGPVSFEAGPYKLAWYLTDDVGAKFDDLARDTPFDYDEEHAWAADGSTSVTHRLRLHYPRAGRRRTDLKFVVGDNVTVTPTVERDGDLYANGILALGAGEGSAMVRADASRPDGRLRRVAVVTDKRARSQRDAISLANQELAARQGLDEITQITVRDHPHARLNSWRSGDEILIEGDLGWVEVSMWVRVLSTTFSPADFDVATLTVAPTATVTS